MKQIVVNIKKFVKRIPIVSTLAGKVYLKIITKQFQGSEKYWTERYAKGGDSGVGSYNKMAVFKAEILNNFVKERDIASTIAGSGSQSCCLLFVGRLIYNKGLSELFRAGKDLPAEGVDFHIWVAGDGSRRKEIQAEAEELGIIEKVDFLGWIAIDKLKDIYRSCDIFVFPSYTEGMPKAVTEAMSNGLASVVTDLHGLRGIVEDGKTGLVVPIKDVAALREAVRKLILDKSLRQQMAKAGLEKSRRFTMEAEGKCVKAALQKFGFLPTR